MFRRPVQIGVLVSFILVSGCGDDPTAPGQAVAFSDAPMLTFTSQNEVGMSRITRLTDEITVSVETGGLEPETAVTLWLLVFNQPENCSGPCGEDDLFNSSIESDVLYLDGALVGSSGEARFVGRRQAGNTDYSIAPALGQAAFGLRDVDGAELQLVVRSHGPLVDGLEAEMTQTFNGGCGGAPPELGTPGPNTCTDVQFAVHVR